MTATDNRNRQPKGVSTGGQFATETRAEARVGLGAPAPAASVTAAPAVPAAFNDRQFLANAAYHLDATEMKEYADGVRETYPDAVAIREVRGYDHKVEYRNAEGRSIIAEDAGDYGLHFPQNNVARELHDEDGWVELDQIDDEAVHAAGVYAESLQKTTASVEREQSSRLYAADLAGEISIRHRMHSAKLDGDEGYTREDAEDFIHDDDLSNHREVTEVVRETLNGATDGTMVDTGLLAGKLSDRFGSHGSRDEFRQDFTAWREAVSAATTLIPGRTSNADGALEVANGAYANTYIGSDGTPVLELNTDMGYSGPVRVYVNDGAVYDGDPEQG